MRKARVLHSVSGKRRHHGAVQRASILALQRLSKTLIDNGKTNWQAFHLTFNSYAEAIEWSEIYCKYYLIHCLTDQALSYGAMLLRRDHFQLRLSGNFRKSALTSKQLPDSVRGFLMQKQAMPRSCSHS